MSAAVIGFAARMEAGKSAVSKRVAEKLSVPRVSFGDYVRKVALDRGLPETRETLQDLGQELVRLDLRGFCTQVINQSSWRPGMSLVIDGVRHCEVLHTLREIVSPTPFRLVYLWIDRETQLSRLLAEDLPHEKPLDELERHPTEAQVLSDLPEEADLLLEGNDPLELLVQQVVDYANRPDDAVAAQSWDEKNSRRIELVRKKHRQGLSEDEAAEFRILQTGFFRYLEAKHPRPPLDLERIERIETRLKQASKPTEDK